MLSFRQTLSDLLISFYMDIITFTTQDVDCKFPIIVILLITQLYRKSLEKFVETVSFQQSRCEKTKSTALLQMDMVSRCVILLITMPDM